MSVRTARCATCLHWGPPELVDGEDARTCRAGPPSIGEGGFGEWPSTFGDDWCGAWSPQAVPPPDPAPLEPDE